MTRIKVLCSSCRTLLVRYDKRGSGALVKLHASRILEDRTSPEDPLRCPSCLSAFARDLTIGHKQFRKLLGGKVFVKGGGISAR